MVEGPLHKRGLRAMDLKGSKLVFQIALTQTRPQIPPIESVPRVVIHILTGL